MSHYTTLFVFLLRVLWATGLQPPLAKEYDFIVVGGGTAGAVVASRLSENLEWDVLLLEAGGDEGLNLQAPLSSCATIPTGSVWNYTTEESSNICQAFNNLRCPWPRGKLLGGTSAISHMIYTRGNRHDYDNWEAEGNIGWGYTDVMPYFCKSENQTNSKFSGTPYHSVDGLVTVTTPNYHTPVAAAFIQSVQHLGYPIRDYNGAHQYGFNYVQATTSKGRRVSSNTAFLSSSVRRRPNLTISKWSKVTRVLIKKNHATGVEVLRDKTPHHILAKKEVILSAGTLNTPQILMLSGIGPKHHLRELQIPVVQDLPVGLNLQDHSGMIGLSFTINESISSLTRDEVMNMEVVEQWLAGKGGPLSVPGSFEALGFVSTTLNKYGPEWPDLEILFKASGVQIEGMAAKWLPHGTAPDGFENIELPFRQQPRFTIIPYGMRPRSRGVIRLRTKDPNDPPLFYPNYLSDQRDVDLTLEGIKWALRISETPIFKNLGARLDKSSLPGCESHEFGSDSYWECQMRMHTLVGHHQVGTCKMGPKGSVVDPYLRVYGVNGLRVVDASIMPRIVSGHPASAVMMIGEKAADMITQYWEALED